MTEFRAGKLAAGGFTPKVLADLVAEAEQGYEVREFRECPACRFYGEHQLHMPDSLGDPIIAACPDCGHEFTVTLTPIAVNASAAPTSSDCPVCGMGDGFHSALGHRAARDRISAQRPVIDAELPE